MFVAFGILFQAVTFTTVNASSDALIDDHFDYADASEAIGAGWVNTNDAETLGTTEFVKVSETDSHGTSMKITKNSDNSGTKRQVAGAGTTGKYQVKFSAYVGEELVARVKYGDNQNYILNFSPTGKQVHVDVGSGYQYADALWQSNVWMDISMMFDLDKGNMKLDITNSDTKQTILSAKEFAIDKNIQINGIEFITWRTSLSYIDDLYVAPYIVDMSVFKEDFEYEDTSEAIAAGWFDTAGSSTLGTAEIVAFEENDSHGKSLRITSNNGSGTRTAISGMETTGKYKIKMSVNIETELVARIKYGNNSDYVLNFSNNGSLYYNDKNGQTNSGKAYLKGAWNDIEMLFDLNKGIWNVKIKNENGDFFNKDLEIDKNIQVNGLEFITWQQGYSYIDDISVERYFAVPSPVVSMKDITGADVDYGKDVTSGIKTISVDFGESMDTATVDGAITLDGEALSGEFDSANQVYTITRDSALFDGEHIFAIADTVENVNGDKMNLSYELEFTSVYTPAKVVVDGLYNSPMGQSLAFHKKPVKHAISGVEASGSYTLKYSYKNGLDTNMLVTAGSKEESVINIGSNNATFVDNQWQGADKNTVRNTWYDVEVVFTYGGSDLAYTATIKDQSGKAIIENVAGNIASTEAINLIKFTSWNTQTDKNYIDNVWFGPTGGTAILKDNFNGYSDESYLAGAGWEKVDAACEWQLESVIDDNSKITVFSDILTAKTIYIKTEYVNPGDSKDAVFLAAYYNDDMLVGLNILNADGGMKAFTSSSFGKYIDLPDKEFDEVAIYCWDSIANMIPYSPAYGLGE